MIHKHRILIKNLMSVRADGWSKEDDEGPLKLKDLHKKIQEEQRGKYLDILRPNLASYYDEYDMYDYDYEESRRAKQNYKPKRDTRRDRPSEDGFSYVESGSIFLIINFYCFRLF